MQIGFYQSVGGYADHPYVSARAGHENISTITCAFAGRVGQTAALADPAS